MELAENVAAYFAEQPEQVREILHQVRQTILHEAPMATETMNYGIPTFKLNGNLIHYAAFKHHIGLYPGPKTIVDFESKLSPYKCTKGAIQFPLSGPMPLELIAEIVQHRVKMQTAARK